MKTAEEHLLRRQVLNCPLRGDGMIVQMNLPFAITSLRHRSAAPGLALLLVLLVCRGAAAAPPENTDLWYTVLLQGQHAGWMHCSETTADGRITTEVQWLLSVSRAGTPVESRKSGRFVETVDGEPVSFWLMQDLGSTPREVLYEFGPSGLTRRITEAGRTSTSTLPLPQGDWQTPREASEFAHARLRGGTDQFTVTSIDVLGDIEPVTTTRELLEAETTINVRGRKVMASKWKAVTSSSPGLAATEYYDTQGVLVRSEVELGGASIVTLLSDRASAMRMGAGPEMMLKTFVRPSKPIPSRNRLKKAVYDLSVTEGDLPDLPAGGAQKIERLHEPDRIRLTIEPAASEPVEDRAEDYLKPSELITCDDEQVIELAQRAVRNVPASPQRRAEAIRTFVGRYIRRKSLGVGLASAAQIARDREGDCTEHAVLTTAMLRAAGIPARLATGLVLVDEFAGQKSIFGYHMWSQALIDGAWVDFDATQPQRFDATHIALRFTAANEDEFLSDMTALLAIMGRLKIDVVSLEY